ncbi:FecR domain-containing protein [Pseudomonas sp. S36]|uniref:FecR domain-containing protein n=1 Tax=Pseudomonas sp. S36 TaxID=2767447 RepID=UPI002E2A7C48|nr:FecR domain-containing protein [Pseudomonas sp. S36]MBK4990550.1 DUF4880 domain-containing protein [Pseudomonas sp. S36]
MNPALGPGQLAALRQAAEWLCQLNSGEARQSDCHAWQQWHDASPDNAWAWQQAERLQGRMTGQALPVARRVLDVSAEHRRASRRRVIKAGMVLLGGTALSLGGYQQRTTLPWLADYRSGVGEQLKLNLGNGTTVRLNTDTALDVSDTPTGTRLKLRQGEIMVQVPLGQQCQAQTTHGRVDTQACRFSLRVLETSTRLNVHQQQARVTLPSGQSLLASQQQRCEFDRERFSPLLALPAGSDAWDQGLIIANGLRLDQLLAELSRYRSGWLHCGPDVAGLRVSGTFRLDDTEQALRAITSALPVRVQARTRYWVTVVRA